MIVWVLEDLGEVMCGVFTSTEEALNAIKSKDCKILSIEFNGKVATIHYQSIESGFDFYANLIGCKINSISEEF